MSKNKQEEKECKREEPAERETPAEETEVVDPIELANREAAEMKELAQRVQAEFDNYRKRNNDAVKIARQDGENAVIVQLFQITDNFERAMEQLDEKAKEGVGLIFKQLSALFEKFGVTEIDAKDAKFDPNEHNAVMTVEDKEKEDTVTEVFQKGYKRNNKVLRAAMVKVAK